MDQLKCAGVYEGRTAGAREEWRKGGRMYGRMDGRVERESEAGRQRGKEEIGRAHV